MKLSIVIPTRERADTLRYALQTCTAQTYQPLEIIVSDNASEDDTREVVESFADTRIRYINTRERLSMASNWEFALRHVQGDYVTFIGDDDGLLPNAVQDVANIIQSTQTPGVGWLKADYAWPSHPDPDARNRLFIPLRNTLFKYSADSIARDLCKFWIPYFRAPVLYNSFVSVSCIRECANGGRFFRSVTPDVYSGMALLSRMESFHFSLRPFSVNGASGHSNGTAVAYMHRDDKKSAPARLFLTENDLPLHPSLPQPIPGSVVAIVLEAFLQANTHCFAGRLKLDVKRVLPKIVRDVQSRDSRIYQDVLQTLTELSAGDVRMQRILRKAVARYPNRPANGTGRLIGFDGVNTLALDASALGICDVHAAAAFVAKLLGPYHSPDRIKTYSWWHKLRARAYRRAEAGVPDLTL